MKLVEINPGHTITDAKLVESGRYAIYTSDRIKRGYVALPKSVLPDDLKNISVEEFNSKYIIKLSSSPANITCSRILQETTLTSIKYIEANPIDTLDMTCDIDGDVVVLMIYEKDEV